MTNNSLSDNSLVLCIDIGTTSLKAAFVSAAGEVFDFKRIEYKSLSLPDSDASQPLPDLPRQSSQDLNRAAQNDGKPKDGAANQKAFQGQNGAAAWVAALREFFPSRSLAACAAVSVSGNGPTIVAADGTTLLWSDNAAQIACKPKTAADENCSKAQEGAASDNADNLFSKIEIPDAQKKIYEPRLAAFKKLFPDVWQKSPRLYTSTQWLCGWIKNNAASIGLPSGVPVFDSGPDFIAALVGTATLFPGRLCDRAGSSEGLNLCSPKFFEAPGLRVMPSPAKGFWNVSCLISDPGSSRQEKLDNFKKAFNALKEAAAANGIPFGGRVVVTGGQARDKDLLVAKEAAVGATITTAQIPDAELLGDAAAAFFRLGTYSSLEEAACALVRLECDVCEQSRPGGASQALDSSVSGGPVIVACNPANYPRFYNVPSDIKAIIFDIDSTLYTNAAYAFEQVDCQVRRFASLRGITNDQARKMVADYRKKYAAENGGKKVSLSNALRSFGVSIEQSVQWRRELIEPADFLGPDKKLQEALAALGRRYKLLCVTNNPLLPAQKTLDALGVADLIEVLVGLDTCNLSKPAKEPFERAANEAGVPFGKIVSVGDRYDLDLAPALELGMGGVLVRGVEDVYRLPELI
ncbi:MAG: HAD family hydrolase [Treponema sp.]|nr:HAD family hydrolase [Treponema sp.]MEE3434438.1 HAD family hydrolase [Treponema sp.]